MDQQFPRRTLGRNGLVVSAIGLGCMGMSDFYGPSEEVANLAVLNHAIDVGVDFLDTADMYGVGRNEELLAKVLKKRRREIVLATKFGSDLSARGAHNGVDWGSRGSRRYIRRAIESSLRRLRTDWIDLYQIHRPDPQTPIEETLSALTDLVHEGKVRYIGHSNFTGWQAAEAEWIARTRGFERFVSAQNEYSWLDRSIESDLVPALEHYEVGLLPYFPLASGLLTGKYRRGVPAAAGTRIKDWGREDALTDAAFDVIEALEAFAADRSITLLDVAMGGLAAQPTVASVIAGATSAAQVAANVAAGSWQPSAEDLTEIRRLTAR